MIKMRTLRGGRRCIAEMEYEWEDKFQKALLKDDTSILSYAEGVLHGVEAFKELIKMQRR